MKTKWIKIVSVFAVSMLMYNCGKEAVKENKDVAEKKVVTTVPVDDGKSLPQPEIVQVIDLPQTKLGTPNWSQAEKDKYVKGKKITQEERLLLKIDDIKDDLLNKNLKNNELTKGKAVYNGSNGRMQSVVIVYDYPREGQEFYEYLISYDASGNYVNHLLVGCKKLYYTNDISAILEGSTITVTNYYADQGDEETTTTEYRISPDLKFNQMQ